MPTPAALKSLERIRNAGSGFAAVLPKRPKLPRQVIERFPEMAKYEKDMEEWDSKANILLGRMQGS